MRGGSNAIRILIGIGIAIFSLVSFFMSGETNPVTGEKQYLGMTIEQEIALGLQSEPELIREFGGLHPDQNLQQALDDLGWRLVRNSIAADTPWEWEFHVLDEREMVNAFALPGGPTFITYALLSQLTEEEAAGVMAHEISHVLARHGAQRMAKSQLTNGLVGAVAVASGDANATQTAAVVSQLINMSYSREDELESDTLGVCIMIDAGYDPQGMADVMQVLAQAGGGGARPPEFLSTHPNPDNRIEEIREAIQNADSECPERD